MADQPFFDREPSRTIVRKKVNEEFDGQVVTRTGGGTKQVLHACDDGESPICGSQTVDDDWRLKSLTVFPYGHRDWCKRCLIQLYPEKSNLKKRVRR